MPETGENRCNHSVAVAAFEDYEGIDSMVIEMWKKHLGIDGKLDAQERSLWFGRSKTTKPCLQLGIIWKSWYDHNSKSLGYGSGWRIYCSIFFAADAHQADGTYADDDWRMAETYDEAVSDGTKYTENL